MAEWGGGVYDSVVVVCIPSQLPASSSIRVTVFYLTHRPKGGASLRGSVLGSSIRGGTNRAYAGLRSSVPAGACDGERQGRLIVCYA